VICNLIKFEHVNKTLGQTRVLNNFNMTADVGKILCIIGPSGCGKTTILQLLAGLEQADSGKITGTEAMRASYVFQEPRLLHWKTVAQNIDFVLNDVVALEQRQELVSEYLNLMGLHDYRNSYPKSLSGGMKQRLALCRAFAYPHDLLLLDEPFKSLDTPLRLGLVRQLSRMWQSAPRTIVLVTHNIMDALLLGHRILVLSARPTVILKEVLMELPLAQRNVAQEPLPSNHAQMLALLEAENTRAFPSLDNSGRFL